MDWNAAQYLKFEAQRNRPVHDLLAQLPRDGVARAIDLGCGPGNSTQLLAARYPAAEISGLDSAPDMVAAARARMPGTRFDLADIAGWAGGSGGDARPDLLFSNAVFQWLPDHDRLFPTLLGRLAPGGTLAAQIPDNLGEPAEIAMRAVAAEPPFRDLLANAAASRAPRHDAAWYHALLAPMTRRLDIWLTTYIHAVDGIDAVIEWFRGTALRPFLEPLDAAGQAAYLARYRAHLVRGYRIEADGRVLLPFPRLFIVAGV